MKKIILIILLLFPALVQAEEPKILINEIAWMGTQNSSNDEWIEFYNISSEEINLDEWMLKSADGSPEINLEGIIKPGEYFLLERTDDDSVPGVAANQIYSGALSNSGENLQLFDNTNILIDEIKITDGWPGGDNTTKQTLERKNLDNWGTSLEPGGTPKIQNDNAEESGNDTEDTLGSEEASPSNIDKSIFKAKKGDIKINEIFPNPVGIDLEKEFLELKNVSNSPIDLTSWTIKNSGGQIFTLPSLKMMPSSIVVFYRHQTNLALNNIKERITLKNTSNHIIDEIKYEKAPEAKSYQNKIWEDPSPGQENIIIEIILPTAIINSPTKAEVNQFITIDASDSFDPLNRELKFYWNFGRGNLSEGIVVEQIYEAPGSYEFSLTAFVNNNASSTKKFKLKITSEEKVQETTLIPTMTNDLLITKIPYIFISEFLPNPSGSDLKNEFIEIFNQDDSAINLKGFKLTDTTNKYFILPEILIKPGQYVAFLRSQTKIALNNDEDEIKLLMPTGEIIDMVNYEDSTEGFSFVLDENFIWQQTKTPTPDELNVLEPQSEISTSTSQQSKPTVLGAQTEEIVTNEPANKNKYFIAGATGIAVFGLGAVLKIKDKK